MMMMMMMMQMTIQAKYTVDAMSELNLIGVFVDLRVLKQVRRRQQQLDKPFLVEQFVVTNVLLQLLCHLHCVPSNGPV